MNKNTLLTIVGIVVLVAIGIHMVLGFVFLLTMEINPKYSVTEILLIVAGMTGLVVLGATVTGLGRIPIILLLMMGILVGLILVSKRIIQG